MIRYEADLVIDSFHDDVEWNIIKKIWNNPLRIHLINISRICYLKGLL